MVLNVIKRWGDFVLWKLLIVVIIIVILFLLENVLRKKLHIPRKNSFIYTTVNDAHKWGEISIFTIYLITSFILIVNFDYINIGYLIFAFLIVLQVFRTFMGWKYDKESKEYVISFLGVICLTISFSVVMYLF
ncbi:DUF4181 domain-containing protein [Bacillus cereus]|uniref:DUF4181 domain-containing protein n=1 Tax=Bacillus cereus TaxID=1396 RepID=UPI0020D21083|nr:DUF4181 domain-containing protein [Bacillus cereus]